LLSREAYFAIAAESKRQGTTLVGHIPNSIRAFEASNAGQKSIEHLMGIVDDTTVDDKAALISLLAKNKTWQCPTLYWSFVGSLIDTLDVISDQNAKYVPSFWAQRFWPGIRDDLMQRAATLSVRQESVRRELDTVKRLHDAGVPFLAGTDAPAGIDLLPGFSLHLELERFTAAGFTPLEALQTATLNPALFLGIVRDFGTVEKGKVADLLLLDANPLDDIRNTRRIRGVFANGRYFPRDHLDHILEASEIAARRY
jgi:imidazolonepropionase-like amidohydrolase